MTEQKIPAPVYPPTLWLNNLAIRMALDTFMRAHLPGFSYRITSSNRTTESNARAGGAVNSAHVHGLAMDFTLINSDGSKIPEAQAKILYTSTVAPLWGAGFTEFEASSTGEGYHIHVNLPRTYSQTNSKIAIGLTIGLAVVTVGSVITLS